MIKYFFSKIKELPWSIKIALFVFILLLLLWWLVPCFVQHWFGSEKARTEVLTYIGGIVGGIIGIGILIENARRNNIMQGTMEVSKNSIELTRKSIELSEKSNIDTRFKDAATLLASKDTSSVISGIFVLHQIAVNCSLQNNFDYVKIISDIFCAKVRELKEPNSKFILQTILDVLVKKDIYIRQNFEPVYLNRLLSHEFGMNFQSSDLSSTNLSHARLNGARFVDASLSGSILIGANLFMAYLFGTKLDNANLKHANLTHANLTNADLTNADLTEASLSSTKFINANLSGVILTDAKFFNADFNGQIFSSHGPFLSGAKFPSAIMKDKKLPSGNNYDTLFKQAKKNVGSDEMTVDVLFKMFELIDVEKKTAKENNLK